MGIKLQNVLSLISSIRKISSIHVFSQAASSLCNPSRTCSRSCPFANRPYRKSLNPPTVPFISSSSVSAFSSSLRTSSSTSCAALSSSGMIEINVCGFEKGRFDVDPKSYSTTHSQHNPFFIHTGQHIPHSLYRPHHPASPFPPSSVSLPLLSAAHPRALLL